MDLQYIDNQKRLLNTHVSQFTKDQIIVLYDKKNDRVGEAIVSALEVGDLLEGNRIHPTEVGVSIIAVYKPTTPVNEIFKDTLGECLHHMMATTSVESNRTICHEILSMLQKQY